MVVGAINNAGRDVSGAEPFSPPSVGGVVTPNPSNYGRCVDLFAPGVDIPSDWDTGDSATQTLSGTSMAAPAVAGAAARYLSTHRGATPTSVRSYLTHAATAGIVNDARNDRARLLYLPR